MSEQGRREARAEGILADARVRAERRQATHPAAAGTIMYYAKLRAQRVLGGAASLQTD